MVGFFSMLNTLVSLAYPIIASCRAFEDYTRVSNSIASQTFKIGGISVPLNLIYNTGNKLDGEDERKLQVHLITIQKWFIYWIVLGCVSFLESWLQVVIFLLPGYSIVRLVFSIWLISPMISLDWDHEQANAATFDQTLEWKKFTNGGAGLLFFAYIKPWLEKNIDLVRKVSINPLAILQFMKIGTILDMFDLNRTEKKTTLTNAGFGGVGSGSGTTGTTTNISGVGGSGSGGAGVVDYANVLDNSFVMVMNLKNRFAGNSGDNVETKEVSSVKSMEEFDVVDVEKEPTVAEKETSSQEGTPKRRGYFW
ncbi:uncharacterized protein LODBEIA_P29780 [Lodderomyces beijingensis]|uniref:Protein YOP1 n=1 Tax=Lodderomyces beijingensis TaxID=1775926 RepID=A0ABP0ZKS6_9ASCO